MIDSRHASAQDDAFVWTIDDAPFREAPPVGEPPAAQAQATAAGPVREAEPIPRRAFLLPALAVALTLLLVWLNAAWASREREAAVRAVVEREERAALAGDLDALRAISDPAGGRWLDERLRRAAEGLPAPLPLRALRPTPAAGWIRSVAWLAPDLVRVDVARGYRAPDGATPTFAAPQFYARSGAEWRRVPAPVEFWGQPQLLEGRFVTLNFRPVDEPWARQLQPELEAFLARACADLDCPPAPVTLIFEPDSAPLPDRAAWRPNDPFLITALPAMFNRYPGYRLRAPSPHSAGYPLDETGRMLLRRTLAVHLLLAAADRAAFGAGDGEDDGNAFFYALAARLAARYGLERDAVLTYQAPPAAEDVSLDRLWHDRFRVWQHPDLIRHGLAHLNERLAGAPPEAEAALLRALGTASSLDEWRAAGTRYNRPIPPKEGPLE